MGTPDGVRRFTFLMDEAMYADLKALAESCDGSVSGLVRDCLERMLRWYYASGGTVSAENPDGERRADVEV